MKKKVGFTLAEILITLSIIGIVAAISIPSLLVNINDKTYDAQRAALLARLSQAIGQMDDINTYEKSSGGADVSSAVEFITKGLSKVYKISSVCGSGHLDSCDIPDKVKNWNDSGYNLSSITTMNAFNSELKATMSFDTKVAAFRTSNGESMLVLYNPDCVDKHEDVTATTSKVVLDEICVNMIYDLNGAGKAPNQFGKDIGFVTVLNPSTPSVVAPVPHSSTSTSAPSYSSSTSTSDAATVCANEAGEMILPDREQLIAMVANKDLIGNLAVGASASTFWSSTVVSPSGTGKAWTIATDGKGALGTRSTANSVRCVKK